MDTYLEWYLYIPIIILLTSLMALTIVTGAEWRVVKQEVSKTSSLLRELTKDGL